MPTSRRCLHVRKYVHVQVKAAQSVIQRSVIQMNDKYLTGWPSAPLMSWPEICVLGVLKR